MAVVRTDGVFGRTSNNPLAIGGTTLNSDGLADLEAVTGGDEAYIVLDPEKVDGDIEIVKVTAHTASATSATIVRAQFGTTARQHDLNTYWIHGPIENDFDHGNLNGLSGDDHTIYVLADGTRTITGPQLYEATSPTSNIIRGKDDGDSNDRIAIRADGMITWGSGSTAGDTNLYRNAASQLKTDDDLVVGGGNIVIGADTEIYRDSANVLKTEDSLTVGAGGRFEAEVDFVNASDTGAAIEVYKEGEGTARFAIDTSGKQSWGTGASAADTNLYRSGVSELTTDDSLVVAGDLTVGGSPYAHVPVGTVVPFAGSSIPNGWLECNWQEVSRTGTYADLFAVLSTTWGVGNGSTTFNVPDLRGNVMIGAGTPNAGSGTEATSTRTFGTYGGEEAHQLSNAEMPSHNHGSAGSHRHEPNDTAYAFTCHRNVGGIDFQITSGNNKSNFAYTAYAGNHTHATNGSDSAHNNVQPFAVIKYIIKY